MIILQANAKPFHLCSVGIYAAGEFNQCQKTGEVWVEVELGRNGPTLPIVLCDEHYKKYKDEDL